MRAPRMKILIVDDDVRFADSVSDILEENHYECTVVHNGSDALSKIRESRYNVVLADIRMPVMNGISMCREIKKIDPYLTVIIMTAFREEELIQAVLKEGAYGCVSKPLDIDRILKLIKRSHKGGAFIEVIDDDPVIRKMLETGLESRGFIVTTVASGEDAIRITKRTPQDIVFLEFNLPSINGLEVFSRIREINPEVKVVMMTTNQKDMRSVLQDALKQGVYALLYKPFNIGRVMKIVEEIVRKTKRGGEQ